jgi:hypothetical protein
MKQEINLTPTAPSRYHDYEATCWENGHEKGVEVGIAYQKEQYKELFKTVALHFAEPIDKLKEKIEQQKELIEELLESLKTVTKIPMYRREFGNGSIDLKAQHAITKAENYLKQ